MMMSHYADKGQRKIVAEEKQTDKLKNGNGGKAPSKLSNRQQHVRRQGTVYSLQDMKNVGQELQSQANAMLKLAEEALPQILQAQSWSQRIWHEMQRHHRWLGVVYYFSEHFPRMMRVVSLATNIIIMLFVQSLTYDLTKGDDGTCEMLKTELDCLEPRSGYSTGESKCYWLASNKDQGLAQCQFVQPDDSLQVVVFVAIFSALVSTPIALFANWVIQAVLSAPTAVGWRKVDRHTFVRGERITTLTPSSGRDSFVPVLTGSPGLTSEVQTKESSVRASVSTFGRVGRSRLTSGNIRPVRQADNILLEVRKEYDCLIEELSSYIRNLTDEAEQKDLLGTAMYYLIHFDRLLFFPFSFSYLGIERSRYHRSFR
jgi:hypothetical protein